MSLSAKDVEQIMKLLEESAFDRLYLEQDGIKLELVRAGAAPAARAEKPPAVATAAAPPVAAPVAAPRSDREAGLVEVKSPLLGTFYHAPKPGEPAFVAVGSKVTADTVIGIIEVMKLMNSVPAGVKGEVVAVLGLNGELVEHGEPLLLVRPEA